jgi:hypothetical protein
MKENMMSKIKINGLWKILIGLTMILLRKKLTINIMSAKLYTSEVFMRKRYLVDKKSPEEIAKECGSSVETIYVYLAKFGLRKSKR